MFRHKSSGACQGWKICLTKEECKFQKDKDGISLLTVSQKTDVSSRVAKKKYPQKVKFSFLQ